MFFIGFILFIAVILMANYGVFGKMPSIEELENPTIAQASEVYASDGTLWENTTCLLVTGAL
ncbi:hypothetical protein KRR40_08175 [Niabella defluvii]|nr:hypothetical protein KRR40_08175 [Niabella sp. I65]